LAVSIPMRPKPFMPTLTAILLSYLSLDSSASFCTQKPGN
jgi:hypothetical protein